jgi:formylglycine-generating enzyme
VLAAQWSAAEPIHGWQSNSLLLAETQAFFRRQNMSRVALAISVLAFGSALTSIGRAEFIDFETGTPDEHVGGYYADLGVQFNSHTIWVDHHGHPGGTGQLGIGCDNPEWPGYIYGAYAIVITFTSPLGSVGITGLDVGDAGARIEAYDAVEGGNLVASDEVYGTGTGYGEFFRLSVFAPQISRLVCYQPLPVSYDGMWFDNLAFPVQVLPGDMNCDGLQNGLDLGAFVLALLDPSGYVAAYPGCPVGNGDFDCDEGVDTDDIEGFVDCLLTGNCPPCGACCLTDGSCTLAREVDCGGLWHGAGSDCDPNPCSPPGMVLIPAGEFQMGDFFGEGNSDELPRHAVYVDAFYMDTYEVTSQQYCDALNWAWAQGGLIQVTSGVVYKHGGTSYVYCDTTTSSSYSRITWDGGTQTFGVTSGKESHPMVTVSWYGSVAYANWRSGMQGKPLCYDLSTWACNFGSGYRLPTEAEWEKAARGGASGHRFPWSDQDTIQHARCNYYSSSYYSYDTSPTRNYHPCWGTGGYPRTSPVGFFDGSLRYKADWGWPGSPTSYQTASGANGYGLHDMAGNVWEWCNDWYSSTYYSSSPYDDPHGPENGEGRLLRGGSWIGIANYCRCAIRDNSRPGGRNDIDGFRCVLGTP